MKVAQKKLKIIWEEFKWYYSNHKERFYLGLLLSSLPLGGMIYCLGNIGTAGTIPGILFWAYMSLWLMLKFANDLQAALGVDN